MADPIIILWVLISTIIDNVASIAFFILFAVMLNYGLHLVMIYVTPSHSDQEPDPSLSIHQ